MNATYQLGVVTFLALFPIVNPLGALPLFFTLTKGYKKADLRATELRIAVYVTGILLTFGLAGRYVLSFFGISLPVLEIAGGLIVANTAWGMATGASRITAAEEDDAATKADISFAPMAMPMLSGPGSIGVVMGIAADARTLPLDLGLIAGVVALGVSVFLVLRLGEPLATRLRPSVIGAMNRIFGFLILAIAVQLMWNGAESLINGKMSAGGAARAPAVPATLTPSPVR